MVEQHGAEIRLEGRRNEPPHVLVATEAMGKHHSAFTAATDLHVVPMLDRHLTTTPAREPRLVDYRKQ
jgi:hypothetical protein